MVQFFTEQLQPFVICDLEVVLSWPDTFTNLGPALLRMSADPCVNFSGMNAEACGNSAGMRVSAERNFKMLKIFFPHHFS